MSQSKFVCLLAIATLLGIGSVSAQNTPPVVGPAGTETFSGTQTAGINVNDGTIFTVNVNALTGPIAPSAGTNGITFTNGSAGNLTLNAGLSNGPITISSTNAAGISILSVGNPPAASTNAFLNNIPIPGTPSAGGGTVIVNSFSNITTTGANSYGITGNSSTSGYSSTVINQLAGFTAANISFTVDPTTTGTLSAFSVILETGTNDGSFTSGTAGSGDQLVLNSDGSFTFVPGATFSGTSIGSVYDIGVGYLVDGTNSSTHGTQTDSGTLVIQVTKTGSNSFTTGTVGSFFTTFGSGTTPSVFPDVVTYVQGLQSLAGASGAGNSVTITNSGTIQTSGSGSHGIYAVSQGGNGSGGRDASITHSSTQGGAGSGGGTVNVIANGLIITGSDNAVGVLATSIGGNGGGGGDSGYTRNAKAGGPGGIGGTVNVTGTGTIVTSGSQSSGILALSQGGNGGGGGAGSTFDSADDGGNGGMGGSVNVTGTWNITTTGNQAHGIWAKSVGGIAGGGGNGGWTGTDAGSGGTGTPGGPVMVISGGTIRTSGSSAFGIYAESIGGFGGNGGNGGGIFYSAGGSGASAGSGGNVSVTQTAGGAIFTTGTASHGIFAQSVGGGGGSGGGAGALVGLGGGGSTGGTGGVVSVTNNGTITVSGAASKGIYAQSIGGGGGDGGSTAGLVAIGGSGSTTSNGSNVTVINTGNISSTSNAIFGQSIGGGGGNGGSSTGWFSFGGSGGGGGDAGAVAITSNGNLTTTEANASAIFGQSLGGGGGNGGNSVAVGAFGSLAIGGGGGVGGAGKLVTVGVNADSSITAVSGTIQTSGANSSGIQAQSVGGGGGNGGFAFAGSISPGSSISIGLGGVGGGGGNSGEVDVYYGDANSAIITTGTNAHGIFAQSVGGGGGSGGFAMSVTAGSGINAAIAFGGGGGTGGASGSVNVGSAGNETLGSITTFGDHSDGILAQSIGGGGGDGGFSIAGSASFASVGSASLSFGGTGGGGGFSQDVNLYSASNISTSGSNSHGLFAQSVGGGGGDGGFSVAGGISTGGAIDLSIGGSGGSGGGSGNVVLHSDGLFVTTAGDRSYGILAQSVGGGGGDGGFSVAGGISAGPSINFGLGGSGGTASSSGTVTVENSSSIGTGGDDSHGIFAQSIGGGGGSGGFSIAGGISAQAAVDLSFGGSAGGGGNASNVYVTNSGSMIMTGTGFATGAVGDRSDGILAQSIGGGGGAGGFSIAGGISSGPTANFSMGGSGGAGGNAGNVQVLSNGIIITHGDDSHGIFAQSVGGGGGAGGFSVTGGISSGGATVGASIGGSGSSGGNAGTVAVGAIISVTSANTLPTFTGNAVSGDISTYGDHSDGILAQSIGGSGGDGGFSVAGGISTSASVNFSMGGAGGIAGASSDVVVDSASSISTSGSDSHGIFAQSVGGGGGSGGFSVTGGVSLGSAAIGVSIGGAGNAGGNAATVTVISSGSSISTGGDHSYGILAQSIGGGGGDGGFSVAGNASQSAAIGFSMGGSGSSGGISSIVSVTNLSNITTLGDDSFGILAQSVGGGGGSGGFSVSGGISTNSGAVNASVGGNGGSGNTAGSVTLTSGSGIIISTGGDRSTALVAQSIGGGGGAGGFSVAGGLSNSASVNFSMGGGGGTGGNASFVVVTSTSALYTTGSDSHGILAQSVGGGGGNGGFSVAGGLSASSAAVSVSLGGTGGNGGNASTVTVTNTGTFISTGGSHSDGILAQSVGGGGGDGGFSVTGNASQSAAVGFSMGGSGADGGTSSVVTVFNTSSIQTLGDDSFGILAQSVGGGGGSGGFSVTGGISSNSGAVSASVGGSGGDGNTAGSVTLTSGSGIYISTSGDRSSALVAQSIGGGGGAGGFSIAGGLSNSSSVNFSMGGGGGTGGNASFVVVTSTSALYTTGTDSHGILAQSVGGGGGNGGFSIAGGFSTNGGAYSASIGGFGGSGGSASTVTVTNSGTFISTDGFHSDGILAQSVGGGGGDGGFSVVGDAASSTAAGFSMGGFGAAGGTSSVVTVTNFAAIQTLQDQSDGILAQSLGGGGGNGGFSVAGGVSTGSASYAVDLSIGGFAGGGGDSNNVILINDGTSIYTGGANSAGLKAQSVGGGGGNGGFSVAGSISASTNVNFSLGGFGGDGGDAGTVTLSNSAAITTHGTNSSGIVAQSVGGGGGDGGFSVAAGISTGTGAKATVNLSIGGFGGGGGNASTVTVTNSGSGTLIYTAGDNSKGIFAQSVGGGGGDGGFSVAGGISNSPDVNLSIGGSGSSGGNGGVVYVDSSSNITTLGFDSDGIFAQSLGGGGGDGGFSIAGGISKSGTAVSVSIGGFGGGGGAGENVFVGYNSAITGLIMTSGSGSDGIYAESIGGGGGNGGMAISGAIATGTGSKTFAFALGGFGGTGNVGGNVTVNTGAVIVTMGDDSDGILAHSVGGGGGNGGLASSGVLSVGGTEGQTSIGFSMAIGGQGGNANIGGAVAVTNSGSIGTMGDNSNGINAYSVGGGGGNGGGSIGISLGTDANSKGKSIAMNVSVGGSGGGGNNGGMVTVTNTGDIITMGDESNGIFAQSVGGGGGNGGEAKTFTFLGAGPGSTVANLPLVGSYLTSADKGSQSNNLELTISVGGFGGSASSGSSVIVSSTANISTYGDYSRGIMAQSIGGGGGNGGDGLLGTGTPADLITIADNSAIYKNLGIGVGGNAGSSGNGGDVTVMQSGTITTTGLGSDAIFAQSVGGGGGTENLYLKADEVDSSGSATGGSASIGLTGKLGIGGAGGAAGNGGTVIVDTTGTIFTSGSAANGIFAQSIGGGGGEAGNVDRAAKEYANIGIGAAFGRDGGGGGNGGNVTISSTSNITTQGDNSNGIFAQSVGGGGGIIGTMGYGVEIPISLFIGSVGGSGTGGIINVTQTGGIFTSGSNSNGIFAQSAGGQNNGQTVNVTLTSGVIGVSGVDADGIFAQSIGGTSGQTTGGQNITILISSGTVQGGYGLSAGVHIMDGLNNVLNNYGTVQALGLTSGSTYVAGGTNVNVILGTAIMGGTMNDTVNNYGVVNGSVDLGSGSNAFYHNSGALLQSGSIVMLGTGNNFYNSGSISPGGTGYLQTTELTGNFIQTGSANWTFDVTPTFTNDQFNISGTANLGSFTNVVNLNETAIATGTGQYTLITATSGLSGTFQFGNFTGGTMPIGLTYTLQNSDTQELLNLAVSTGTFYWRGGADNTWNGAFVNGQSNWTSDVAGNNFIYGTPGSLVDVVFSSSNPSTLAPITVLGADFPVNSLTITDTNTVAITGSNTLTIYAAQGAGITVNPGAGTTIISSLVALAGSQTWTNNSVNPLDIVGDTVSGTGQNLTVQGSGTTNITAIIQTGNGSLTKQDTGTLMLSASNTYSGGSFLKNGNLVVANPSALGTGNVNLTGGVLTTTNQPANIPTTPLHLNVGGSYTQSTPAILQLRIIGPTGVNDEIVVAGAANLGGTFMPDYSLTGYTPVPPSGKYTDAFTILHATGGVSGGFSSFVDPYYNANKLLRWEPVYGPTDVILEWDQYPFSNLPGLTANQTSVANALNLEMGLPVPAVPKPYNESTGPSLDAHPALAAAIIFLNNESLANLPHDYDLISPEQLTAIFSIENSLSDMQGNNIENRLADIRNGGGQGFSATGFNLSDDHGSINIATLYMEPATGGIKDDSSAGNARPGDDKSAMRYKTELRPDSEVDPRWGVFVTGGGEFGKVGSDLNARGYDFDTGGITIGADYRFNDHFAVGFMGGYANTKTRLDSEGSIGLNSGEIGVYSTLYGHGFYMNAMATGGYETYDTHRAALGGIARGDTNGDTIDGLISGGYDAQFGKFKVGPIASVQYTYVGISGFTETGSLLPVNVVAQNEDSLRTKLGVKASYDWRVGNSGIVISPVATAEWQHEFLDSSFALDSNFADGAGNLFTVQGPVLGRDSLVLNVGINVQWTARFGTFLDYNGEFGRANYRLNGVSGGAKLSF